MVIFIKIKIDNSVAEWIPGRRNDPTRHTESPYLNKMVSQFSGLINKSSAGFLVL